MGWSIKDIPSQAGKLALVTGATGGLGYETALELARVGADVVLTGRNAGKGASALQRIKSEIPDAKVSYENLDLSLLANVSRFAEDFSQRHDRLDILINNAGIMAPPTRETTPDGLELQFATNYLSHFALTAKLLPLLIAAPAARVVPLASIAARNGRIDFANLQSERDYNPMTSYSQTKLACLMFGFELQRRSDANGWGIASIAAHPGVSRTELVNNGMGEASMAGFFRRNFSFMFQPVPQGALPTLMAATDPAAKRGGYYGPQGIMEVRGMPAEASRPSRSLDAAVARQLWDVSEQLSGVRFPQRPPQRKLRGMNESRRFQRARKPEEIEARRLTLLAAAAELFDADGPLGAGLNAIAAKAGFTKSNVYRYFESREQVLLELFLAEMDRLVPEICARLAEATEADVAGLADILAGGFASRPRLCHLTSILVVVIEANVSEETIMRTKRTMGAQTARIADALQARLPSSSVADCLWAISMIGTLVAGMWPGARPSPAAARVLALDEFAAFRPNVERDLKRAAQALLASIAGG